MDVTDNGIHYEWKQGGPWNSEAVCILYRHAGTTDADIVRAKEELERYGDIYAFEERPATLAACISEDEIHGPDDNASEKREMITALCNSLRDALIDSIHKMPVEWNGFEIRQLGSDLLRERLIIPMDAKRMRRYRREKLNRNL